MKKINVYPNLYNLIQVALILPISSAKHEHLFFSIQTYKNIGNPKILIYL